MQDLRDITLADPGYPRVVFVHQGTLEDGDRFFAHHWPEAHTIADPRRHLFDAFGLSQGSLGQMFGAPVWSAGLRSVLKGNFVGRPVGDPWMMPGYFLLQDGGIRWSYRPTHAGDHPDLTRIPELTGLRPGEAGSAGR